MRLKSAQLLSDLDCENENKITRSQFHNSSQVHVLTYIYLDAHTKGGCYERRNPTYEMHPAVKHHHTGELH
jgi:hypothetical protein